MKHRILWSLITRKSPETWTRSASPNNGGMYLSFLLMRLIPRPTSPVALHSCRGYLATRRVIRRIPITRGRGQRSRDALWFIKERKHAHTQSSTSKVIWREDAGVDELLYKTDINRLMRLKERGRNGGREWEGVAHYNHAIFFNLSKSSLA